jgi:hypothetical protein
MRTVLLASLVVLPLALSFACKPKSGAGGDASTDGSASASASASAADASTATASATATSTTHYVLPTHVDGGTDAGPSVVAIGNPCTPKDGFGGFACGPDGVMELTCASGKWAVQQVCKGPGACKQDGTGVHCDTGAVMPGDPCTAGATPSCTTPLTLFSCVNGKWTSSLCVPPAKCQVVGGTARCK